MCACFQSCCSISLRVNVFVMRILFFWRFYAAAIHSVDSKLVVWSALKRLRRLWTLRMHTSCSAAFIQCAFGEKYFFHSSVFFNHRHQTMKCFRAYGACKHRMISSGFQIGDGHVSWITVPVHLLNRLPAILDIDHSKRHYIMCKMWIKNTVSRLIPGRGVCSPVLKSRASWKRSIF